MGLFKPKGKHAQKAGVQPVVIRPDEAEGEVQAPDEAETAEAPVVEAAPESAAADAATAEESTEATTEVASEGAAVEGAAVESAAVEGGTQAVSDGASPTPHLTSSTYAGSDAAVGFVAVTADGVELHKKRSAGKVVGIVFGVIIGVLLVAYIAGAIVFMNFFLPRTTIVGDDVSMMGNAEVAQLIDDKVENYTLDVIGNGFSYRTTAKDIDLQVDSQAVVDAMHADLNAWTWPVLLFQGSHDESGALEVTFDSRKYDTSLSDAVTAYNAEAVAPVDATIAYDEQAKKFQIVPEVAGTQYDSRIILAAMKDSISSLNPKVKLTSDHLIQPRVFSTDERLVNSAELATGLVSAHVTLTMAGQNVAEVNGDNLSSFIRMDDNLGVTLDEEALDQWVTDLSNSFDTVGTERTYTRPDGKVITVSGGVYGWSTDAPQLKEQVVEAVKAGQTTTIDIPCVQSAAVYNGKGQPDWGNRYIDVDLSEQYVRFYGDDGSIIWETACISGTPDGEHNTWPGVWYITNKESPSKLIGYLPNGEKEYETTVSYWMAFEGNGIGLHDATWQPSFGGSMYANGYGSHGCVNISYDAAQSLYGICNWGDVVIAHY